MRRDRHDEIAEQLARKRGQAMGGIEGARPRPRCEWQQPHPCRELATQRRADGMVFCNRHARAQRLHGRFAEIPVSDGKGGGA